MSGENEPKRVVVAVEAAEDAAFQAELEFFEPLLEGGRPTPDTEQHVSRTRYPRIIKVGEKGTETHD